MDGESDDDSTFDNENVDSGNVSSDGDDFAMEIESNISKERQSEPEEYPFEVLTTDQIVQHMIDSIREVTAVVEVMKNFLFLSLFWFKVFLVFIASILHSDFFACILFNNLALMARKKKSLFRARLKPFLILLFDVLFVFNKINNEMSRMMRC